MPLDSESSSEWQEPTAEQFLLDSDIPAGRHVKYWGNRNCKSGVTDKSSASFRKAGECVNYALARFLDSEPLTQVLCEGQVECGMTRKMLCIFLVERGMRMHTPPFTLPHLVIPAEAGIQRVSTFISKSPHHSIKLLTHLTHVWLSHDRKVSDYFVFFPYLISSDSSRS